MTPEEMIAQAVQQAFAELPSGADPDGSWIAKQRQIMERVERDALAALASEKARADRAERERDNAVGWCNRWEETTRKVEAERDAARAESASLRVEVEALKADLEQERTVHEECCRQADSAHAQVEALRGALERWGIVRWQDDDEGNDPDGPHLARCRSCGRISKQPGPVKHRNGCDVAAALASLPAPQPGSDARGQCSRCYGHGMTVNGEPCPECRAPSSTEGSQS